VWGPIHGLGDQGNGPPKPWSSLGFLYICAMCRFVIELINYLILELNNYHFTNSPTLMGDWKSRDHFPINTKLGIGI
jgi:hypothetical protein